MARRGENIYKRKDGRWEGRYIQNRSETGKAIYGYIYGKTYLDVKNRLSLAKANIPKKNPLELNPKTFTFEEIAFSWINDISNRIKISTQNKYYNILNDYLFPEFKNVSLTEITNDIFDKYINCLLSQGGTKKSGLSSKTVSDVVSVYRSIIKYAKVKGIPISCDGTNLYIKRSSKNMRILSFSEQNKMIQCLSEDMNLCNLGILLTLNTGLRIGELCALQWEDISFEDKVIHINKTMQRIQVLDGNQKTQIIITPPKSASSVRDIPIPDHILMLLSGYKNNTGYFLTASKTRFIEPRTMENKFKKITEK